VGDPIFLSAPRADSNTAVDFLTFVLELLRSGFLSPGDIFVVDNSSVHYAESIREEIDDLLESYSVRMYFLPAYCPELNPCELVFAQAKYYLRRHRNGDLPFVFDIALAFSQISSLNITHYYDRCLNLSF